MATGMRTWLVALACGTAAVALVGLPPRDSLPSWNATDARRAHARDLRAELVHLDDVLRRTRVADSLRTVITDRDASPAGMLLGHPPGWEPSTRTRVVERRLSDEVGALADRNGTVVLGVFWVPATQGRHPHVERPPDGMASLEWYGGELPDGRSYCLVTVPVHARRHGEATALEPALEGHGLGPCAWWGRFGAPGPGVERWLARGGAQLTLRRTLGQDDIRYLEEAVRNPFGAPGYNFVANGALRRCLDGAIPVCTALFTTPGAGLGPGRAAPSWLDGPDPDDAARPRARGYLGRLWRWPASLPMGVPGSVVLADLEAEFGTRAVREFWTSGQPVDGAFRAAFGTDPGGWTRRWLSGYYAEAGWTLDPLPTVPATLSVAALLVVAAALAGAVSRRRRLD